MLRKKVFYFFWKKTTAKGIVASVVVGIVSSLTLILLSPSMYEKLYGFETRVAKAKAIMPLDNPGVISIPLSFLTIVVVSLLTKKKEKKPAAA